MTSNFQHSGANAGKEDSGENSYLLAFDSETDTISETVIAGVAALTDTSWEECPVFYETVDPDALDTLFAPQGDGTDRAGDWCIEFVYANCAVQITADGVIALTPLSGTAE